MKTKKLCSFLLAAGIFSTAVLCQTTKSEKILLRDNWAIQSSTEIKAEGKTISSSAFEPVKWYPATVPSTVLGTLVENKVYPDPYFGTNIESIPGYTASRRAEMPENSPFKVAWWYRTVFSLPSDYKGDEYLAEIPQHQL